MALSAQKVKIAPSILSADFARLGDEVAAICKAGCDYVHVDVMDGHFVPNITMGPAILSALKPYASKPLDVHLMIAPVAPYIKAFAEAGADIISFHPEVEAKPHDILQAIHRAGCRAGLALNPQTPASVVADFLDALDMIIVMSVHPGFGGQKFIASQMDKIREVREMINKSGRNIELTVDGGITLDNAADIIAAGADVLVAGTAGFSGGPAAYADNIKALRGRCDRRGRRGQHKGG